MKNVLVTSNHTIFPVTSGGQKGIFSLIERLQEHYRVHIFSPDKLETTLVQMHSGWGRFFGWGWFFTLLHSIKKEHIDTIVMNYPRMCLPVWILCRISHVNLILYEHNIEYQRMRETKKRWRWVLYPYELLVTHLVDEVWFVSNHDLAQATRVFFLSSKKVHFVPFVPDKKNFTTDGKDDAKQYLRSTYACSDETKIILFAGSLAYYPNKEAVEIIFADIYPRLIHRMTNFIILICGTPIPEDYNKYEHIVFTGFVDDIALYFKGCDVFINPIVSGGGVKIKLVEALACGAYCVSTKKGAEGIPSGTTGTLIQVPHNDRTTFVSHICGGI